MERINYALVGMLLVSGVIIVVESAQTWSGWLIEYTILFLLWYIDLSAWIGQQSSLFNSGLVIFTFAACVLALMVPLTLIHKGYLDDRTCADNRTRILG